MEYSTKITRRAPAAVNPFAADYKARIMLDGAVAGEVVVSGAAAGLIADRPIGVCVHADASLGGASSIAVDGIVPVRVGAAPLVKGVDTYVQSDLNGAAVAAAIGANVWTIGVVLYEETAVIPANGLARVLLNPQRL
jgi:hypothetical protein